MAPTLLLALVLLGACAETLPPEVPVVKAVSPTAVDVGTPFVQVVVEGSRFRRGDVIICNGWPVPTTFHDDHKLVGTIHFLEPGVSRIQVRTEEGEDSKGAGEILARYATPLLTGISPDTASTTRTSASVTITGSGFSNATVLRWNGAELPVASRAWNEIRFALGPEHLEVAGTYTITLSNPGDLVSAPRTFTVVQPPLRIGLTAYGATAGRGGFTLGIYGQGFTRESVVTWNGAPRPVRYFSPTRMELAVPASDVAAAGSVTIQARNPTGEPSNPAQFTVRDLGITAVTSAIRIPVPGAQEAVWSGRTGRLYVSIRSAAGGSVAAVDPASGQITGTVVVGSDPGTMAVSGDGRYLYVVLGGGPPAGEGFLRRIDLDSFTPDLRWSIGSYPADIETLPGEPETVVVAGFGQEVAVYDRGVLRPGVVSGGRSVAVLESATEIYGLDVDSNESPVSTLAVSSSGLREVIRRGGLFANFPTRVSVIAGAAGRIYGSDGSVVDIASWSRAGRFNAFRGVPIPEAATGRVYTSFDATVSIFDMNTFQTLAQFPVPAGTEPDYFRRQPIVRAGPQRMAYVSLRSGELVIIRSPSFGP